MISLFHAPDRRRDRRLTILRSFLGDRRGQDLVEYALLVATIGLATLAAGPAIQTALSAAYAAWNINIQDNWNPPDPGAGS
jgi:Flp pilus assembly pilin Flp